MHQAFVASAPLGLAQRGHIGALLPYFGFNSRERAEILLGFRRAVVSYRRKYVHEVLANRLGGLSLPRKIVVRLTDRPDTQQHNNNNLRQDYGIVRGFIGQHQSANVV